MLLKTSPPAAQQQALSFAMCQVEMKIEPSQNIPFTEDSTSLPDKIKTKHDIERVLAFGFQEEFPETCYADIKDMFQRKHPKYEDLLDACAHVFLMLEQCDSSLLQLAEPAKKYAKIIAGASSGARKGLDQRKHGRTIVDQTMVRSEFKSRSEQGNERPHIVAVLARKYGVTGTRINQILRNSKI